MREKASRGIEPASVWRDAKVTMDVGIAGRDGPLGEQCVSTLEAAGSLGAIGRKRWDNQIPVGEIGVGQMQLFLRTFSLALAFAAGILLVSGCGKVDDDAASRSATDASGGATQGTGGTASSSGGSGSTLPTVDAGQDAEIIDPNCGICCGLFVPASCATHIQVQADVRTPNVLLVVDKSASMNRMAADAGTDSQWVLNWWALASTITLQRLRGNINFGLELFPFSAAGIDASTTDPVQACQVQTGAAAIEIEIDARTDQVDAILNLLKEQNPGGYSPTAKALDAAYSYYTTGNGKDLKGSKSVILVTNGAADCNSNLRCLAAECMPNIENSCPPNDETVNCCANADHLCLDDVSVAQAISKLAAAGIGTFVVGQPLSETEVNDLNDFAQAGGVPNPAGANGGESYYPIGSSSPPMPELITALSNLTTQLVTTCDIPLNTSGPIDPNSVLVAIDCQAIPQVPSSVYPSLDAGNANGWMIDNSQSPPHLLFVGSTCQNMKQNGAKLVDIVLGCPGP